MCNCNCGIRENGSCLKFILALVVGLFVATIALILGAVFGEFLLTILAPLVILAIVLFVMALVLFVYTLCVNRN